jgi:hypothetical protein
MFEEKGKGTKKAELIKTNLHVRLLHGCDGIVVRMRMRCIVTALMMVMMIMMGLVMMMVMRGMLLPPPLTSGPRLFSWLNPLTSMTPSALTHSTYFFLQHIPIPTIQLFFISHLLFMLISGLPLHRPYNRYLIPFLLLHVLFFFFVSLLLLISLDYIAATFHLVLLFYVQAREYACVTLNIFL